jgi:nitrilase
MPSIECGLRENVAAVKVAAIQMTSGIDVEANLRDAGRLLREAAGSGACLAVLPENFAFLGRDDEARLRIAEAPGSGPVQSFLSQHAAELGLWLVGGTTPLRGDGSRACSASLLFGPNGECRARYDKIHLFDVALPGVEESYRESATAIPGDRAVSVPTDIGRIGLAVCYDVRFPALFQRLGELGMDVLCVPAAFTVPTGEAHWSILLRARAIESLCYVVAAAQTGTHDGGRKTYGHSMIIGPWGEILAERPAGPGIAIADLDMMRLKGLRTRFPALSHRRTLSAMPTAS